MIYCGTGHRPDKLGGYSLKVQNRLFDLACAVLSKFNPDKVISGMALGWDRALAFASLELGIPLLCAIPFKNQECRWNPDDQEAHRYILEVANEVVIVSQGTYTPSKMQIRNDWMLDHSDEVLALWDGSKGGTGNCVESAIKKNKKIHNFWKSWEKYGNIH